MGEVCRGWGGPRYTFQGLKVVAGGPVGVEEPTAQLLVNGISSYMGSLNTRLGPWVNFSVVQAPRTHGIFNDMIAHP